MAAGGEFSLAIRSDGALFGWGNDYLGEVGIGQWQNDILTPTQIYGQWTSVEAGYDWVLARCRRKSLGVGQQLCRANRPG